MRPPTPSAALCAAVAISVLWGGSALAQVLEVGEGGAVTRLAGPAVTTSAGVTPLIAAAAPADRDAVGREIAAAAARHGVDPRLVRAVALQESGLRQEARSARGAVGVMQLMPATARALGVDADEMAGNVEGGTAYLGRMLRRFGGDVRLALAAYNAGPGAVERHGGPPPFRETRDYVRRVLAGAAAGAPAAAATLQPLAAFTIAP